MNDQAVTHGTGNVFADLGIPDAEDALAKADVVIAIQDAMDEHGLSVERASALAGLDPTALRLILRGRVSDYSLDELATILTCVAVMWKQSDNFPCDKLRLKQGFSGQLRGNPPA